MDRSETVRALEYIQDMADIALAKSPEFIRETAKNDYALINNGWGKPANKKNAAPPRKKRRNNEVNICEDPYQSQRLTFK